MKIYRDRKPENCNHCIYRENVSRCLDLDDYCRKNMKRTGKIDFETDCPLRKSGIRKYVMKIFEALMNRRKEVHETEDIIQMNSNISLIDKEGKDIEIKVPEPEYMVDSIW